MNYSTRKHMLAILENPEAMQEAIAKMIVRMQAGRGPVDELFTKMITRTYQGNSALVHEHCESPIEKHLFNALQMAAIADGTFIFVRPPAYNFNAARAVEENRICRTFECNDFYNNLPPDARPDTFTDFLGAFHEDLADEDVSKLHASWILDCELGFSHYPHLVLQQPLSGIFPEGIVRPDAILFVPTNPKILVIVECDGHEFHGSKEAFIADRQRDRRFMDKGFTVRRYSGSEIFNNPAETAMDLLRCLEDGQCGPIWKDKWEANLRASNSKPRPGVIESWRAWKRDHATGISGGME